MEAQPVHRAVYENRSVMVKHHRFDHFFKMWHYHPEAELVIVLESTGTRFVGDSIRKFGSGEIVMIGRNLPHLWQNDPMYFSEESNLKAEAYVMHFGRDFADRFSDIPEFRFISHLFNKAERGIWFEEADYHYVCTTAEKALQLEGFDQVMCILKMLRYLHLHTEHSLLSSLSYVHSIRQQKESKILRVYEYVMSNFTDGISMADAAEHVDMNPSAFSRYFQRSNKKTFTRFLNDIRIGYACKLLIEEKYTISEICFRSGFNNISNFNRRFKAIKQMTPSEYIAKHAAKS